MRERVIYVGPMGCRTGFYLLLRGMNHEAAILLVKDALKFISEYEGEIPGATEAECGNYLEHDLAAAKEDVKALLSALDGYTPKHLVYPQ